MAELLHRHIKMSGCVLCALKPRRMTGQSAQTEMKPLETEISVSKMKNLQDQVNHGQTPKAISELMI